MRTAEATRVDPRELQKPLERPITVRRGTTRFTLSAEDAGVKADVGGMVDEALQASRNGTIITRVARDLTGGEENAQVPPRVTYSSDAVHQLVNRVRGKLNRPARDAEVDFPSLEKVREQKGRRVKAAALEQRIAQALDRARRGPRRQGAGPGPEAEGHSGAARREVPRVLIADRYNYKLRLYKNLQLTKEYTVAVGAVGFDTPAGLYHIQNKAIDPAWHVPNSDWAGDLAGTVCPAACPRTR